MVTLLGGRSPKAALYWLLAKLYWRVQRGAKRSVLVERGARRERRRIVVCASAAMRFFSSRASRTLCVRYDRFLRQRTHR